MAHKWTQWLHNPGRLGGPHRFRAAGRTRSGPQRGRVATEPLPPGGCQPLQSGGAESQSAHKWAGWLHNPCCLGGPHLFRAGGRIRSGPQGHPAAAQSLPPWGSPPLQSGGQNHKWPTSGPDGYITSAAWGVPTSSKRRAESEVAHKWAGWLHNPYRLQGPDRFKAGGRIRSGPQVGPAAAQRLPPVGSRPLQSRGQNQKWPTSGPGGYITLAA